MKAGERILALALGGALGLAASAPLRAETWSPLTMKPLYAVSLDAGTKHVVSYFLNSEKQCKLTLMISERPASDSDAPHEPAARVQVAIDAGKAARVDSAEGKTIEFACTADAKGMTAAAIDRTALYRVSE
jgi:hypothetical protein